MQSTSDITSLDDHFLEIFSKKLVRGSNPILGITKFSTTEDLVTAIKLTFYTRSIKNGVGEKDIFYNMFIQLYNVIPAVAVSLLPFIVDPDTGGSWKDLCRLSEYMHGEGITLNVVDFFATQLLEDLETVLKDEAEPGIAVSISLAAKYAPSEHTKFWDILGRDIAIRMWNLQNSIPCTKTNVVYANYRKILSKLRKRIDIVESYMCAGEWSKIEFSTVPSIAMQKYGRWAFPNLTIRTNDKDRTRIVDRINAAKNFKQFKEILDDTEHTIKGGDTYTELTPITKMYEALDNPVFDNLEESTRSRL